MAGLPPTSWSTIGVGSWNCPSTKPLGFGGRGVWDGRELEEGSCCGTQAAPPAAGFKQRLTAKDQSVHGLPRTASLPWDEGGFPSSPVASEFTAFTDKSLKLQGGGR